MRANSGKTRNHHALHWLVEPLQAYNRQNVQILNFHPISPGTVASATWRLTVLSRMLSPCFLTGAPLQHGRMRLTQPRGFRALRHWVWHFHIVSLLFVHSFIRYVFHILSLKALDLFYDWGFGISYKVTVFLLWFINARWPVTPQLYAAKVVFTQRKRTTLK